MKVLTGALRFVLLASVLFAVGCNNSSPTVEGNSSQTPFAVLSIAPVKDWFPEAVAMMNNRDVQPVSDEKLQKMLGGIDVQKPCAALLYVSDDSLPEPVLYIPVSDFEQFQSLLKRNFELKLAGVSSFKIGPYKILVKEMGQYAIMGTSLEGLNDCPPFPESYVQDMPQAFDFAFKMHTQAVHQTERQNIAKAIEHSLGKAIASVVEGNDSFSFAVNVDATKELGLQAHLNPLPANPEEFQESLKSVLASRGLQASTKVSEEMLVLDIAMPSSDLNENWNKAKPVLTSAFKLHLDVLANRATKYQRAPAKQVTQSCGLPSTSSGGGGGSGASKKRRR